MTRFTVAGRERLRCCAQQEREREQRIFLCLLENLYHYYSAFLSSGRSCRRNAHTRRATRRGSAAALLTDVQTNTPAPSSRPLSVTPPRTVCHIGSLSPCPIPLFFLYVLSPQFIFFYFYLLQVHTCLLTEPLVCGQQARIDRLTVQARSDRTDETRPSQLLWNPSVKGHPPTLPPRTTIKPRIGTCGVSTRVLSPTSSASSAGPGVRETPLVHPELSPLKPAASRPVFHVVHTKPSKAIRV